jgi:hypothetical protein
MQQTPDKKYYSKDKKLFKARLKQILQLRKHIDDLLAKYSDLEEKGPEKFSDIILLTGNFGVNARNCSIPVKELNLKHLDKIDDRASQWIESNLEDEALNATKPDKLFQCFSEYDFLNQVLSNW